MSSLSNNIQLFNEKYKNFIHSRDIFLDKNKKLIEKTKKFVSLEKNPNVTKGIMGTSNTTTTGIVTKDGMFIGSVDDIKNKNDYCYLDSVEYYEETKHLHFDSNNQIFYAEKGLILQINRVIRLMN